MVCLYYKKTDTINSSNSSSKMTDRSQRFSHDWVMYILLLVLFLVMLPMIICDGCNCSAPFSNGCCDSNDCNSISCNSAICMDNTCVANPDPNGTQCNGGACSSGVCLPYDCTHTECKHLTTECELGLCMNSECIAVMYQNLACDDGKVCTTNDICVSGVCTGEDNQCFDGDPCTFDQCGVDGCIHPTTFNSFLGSDDDYCDAKVVCNNDEDCQGRFIDHPDIECRDGTCLIAHDKTTVARLNSVALKECTVHNQTSLLLRMTFAIDTPIISYANNKYHRIAKYFSNVNGYGLTFADLQDYNIQLLVNGSIDQNLGRTTGFSVETECEAPFSCEKFADKTYTFIVDMKDCPKTTPGTTSKCLNPIHKLQIFANVSYKYCPKHYIATVTIENKPIDTLILSQNNNIISSLNESNGYVSVTLNSTRKLFVWDVGLFAAGGELNYISNGNIVFTENAAGIKHTTVSCPNEEYIGGFTFDPQYVYNWCRGTQGDLCYMHIKYFTKDECPYNTNATEGKLLLVIT